MRLLEVRTTNAVYSDDNVGHTYMHEKNGYTMQLEQGIVRIDHPSMTGGRIVAFASCSATPAPAAKAK